MPKVRKEIPELEKLVQVGRKKVVRYEEGAQLYSMNNSLAEVHPELVSEWSEKNKIKPTEVSIGSHKKVIWRCEKGVDLVPANLELSAMEFNLVNAMSRETTLKNYLSQVKNRYDYVIISCVSI